MSLKLAELCVTVPTFSTVILTLGFLSNASEFPTMSRYLCKPPQGSPVLGPCPSSQRASHAQVVTGYVLVSIARSRLTHARYMTKRDHPPQKLREHVRRRRPADYHKAEVKGRTRQRPCAHITLQLMQPPCASRNITTTTRRHATHDHADNMISRHRSRT